MSEIYEISVQREFAAAHCLKGYPGDCAGVHGHNWTVEAVVRCGKLDGIGIGIDFRELRKTLQDILEELDHTDLNAHPAFREINPTSENLARYLFRELGKRLPGKGVQVAGIRVSESPGASVFYQEK
jgi:6-pyruvoyltetrahydropterin/6-carboxytetrahydropterin synthase